jgi:hypothetical protein
MSSPATQQPTPQLFFQTINSYQRTETLKAAIELEVFTAIGELVIRQLIRPLHSAPDYLLARNAVAASSFRPC